MAAFEDTYLSPLNNCFTTYSGATMLCILIHLYDNYARISATDLAKNDKNLREPYNPDNPLKSLYTRLKECID